MNPRSAVKNRDTFGDIGHEKNAQGLDGGALIASRRPIAIGKLFTAYAVLQVVFLVLLVSVVIVHKTFLNNPIDVDGHLESSWAWLVIAALAWVLVNFAWALRAIRRRSHGGFESHLALVIACGWIVIGIQAAMFARSFAMQPLVLDYSLPAARTTTADAAESATATIGDPKAGEKVFSTTCITCHGPRGGGLANLAPSLQASKFIASSDDAAVASVIRQGRAVGDPNNKSGKMMPARGGNPFLGEEDISHLVAFLRTLESGTPAASGGPSVSLARWVVPTPNAPPDGFNLDTVARESRAGLDRMPRDAGRRQTLIRGLTLALTGVHGLFVLGVLTVSSNLLLPRLLATRRAAPPRMFRTLTGIGWWIAAIAWVFVAWLCFWWR